jgi:hypothetical protein
MSTEMLARLKDFGAVTYHRAGYAFCCVKIALLKASVPFVVNLVWTIEGPGTLRRFTDHLDKTVPARKFSVTPPLASPPQIS